MKLEWPFIEVLLNMNDIVDWPALCSRLSTEGRELPASPSSRIWEFLSQDIRELVIAATQAGDLKQESKRLLVAELNSLLKRRDFYQPRYFEGVAITDNGRMLLRPVDASLSDREVEWRNRLLLDAFYPKEIRSCEPRGYMDEEGWVDTGVHNTAGELWIRRGKDYALSLLDGDDETGRQLMCKASARVTRILGEQTIQIKSLAAYLYRTYARSVNAQRRARRKRRDVAEGIERAKHRTIKVKRKGGGKSVLGVHTEEPLEAKAILITELTQRMDPWTRRVFALRQEGRTFEEIAEFPEFQGMEANEIRSKNSKNTRQFIGVIQKENLINELKQRVDSWTQRVFEYRILGHTFEEIAGFQEFQGMKPKEIETKFKKQINPLMEQIRKRNLQELQAISERLELQSVDAKDTYLKEIKYRRQFLENVESFISRIKGLLFKKDK